MLGEMVIALGYATQRDISELWSEAIRQALGL